MDSDVLICGAGAPGLTLALLLGRLGLLVTVVDRAALPTVKDIKASGRTAALMMGSVNILKAAGGWDAAETYGAVMRILRIIDDSFGKGVTVEFKADEIGLEAFGVNMPNGMLIAALADAAKHVPAISFAQGTLAGIETDSFGVTATLDTGRSIRARLLVGADGRESAVRRLAEIEAQTHGYGQQAITCLISHTKSHEDCSTEFHRPSGPFTLVPMLGKMSSVVWVDHDAQAEAFMALKRPEFVRALQDRTKGILGEVTLEGAPSAWPLVSLRANSLTATRIVLIAEAAHVLHPLGAQGLNLSLRDAAVLAETVTDAVRLGQDCGGAAMLRTYERRRRHDLMSRVVGTDGLNRLVSQDLGFLKAFRQAGLRAVGGIAPLKTFAMKQGLAPALDESRLARGEAL